MLVAQTTINSVMAVASRNGVDVVTNDVSSRQTPSAIYFAGDHRLIGEHSAGHAGSNPRNLINHIKFMLQDRPPSPLNVSGERRRPDVRGSRGAGSSGREEGQSGVRLKSAEEESVQQRQQQRQQKREIEKSILSKEGRPHAVESGQHDNSQSSTTATEKIDEDGAETDSGGDDSIAEEPSFFSDTRSPEDTNQAGRVAVVKHMGEELELGASEAIAYLLGHCAEVVVRGAGGEEGAAGAGGNESAGALSSCVVASVPSHFSLRQRRAVLDAASIAGVPMPMVSKREMGRDGTGSNKVSPIFKIVLKIMVTVMGDTDVCEITSWRDGLRASPPPFPPPSRNPAVAAKSAAVALAADWQSMSRCFSGGRGIQED